MTDLVSMFNFLLQTSLDGLVWSFSQIPLKFQDELPPDPRWGTWSPARHIWHITEYERCLVIPSMEQWLNESQKPDFEWPDDDETWVKVHNRGFEKLSAEFKQIRQRQIDMLPHLVDINWQVARDTLWGAKPLSFIVTKTFQHTYEHADTLLGMVLWWQVENADI